MSRSGSPLGIFLLAVCIVVGVVMAIGPRKLARHLTRQTAKTSSFFDRSLGDGIEELAVQVVDRASAMPLGGCRVWSSAVGAGSTGIDLAQVEGPEDVRETNPDGEAVLAVRPRARLAVARRGDLWGCAALEAGQHTARIELVHDFALTVRVLDASGRPVVGIPVVLRGSSEVLSSSFVSQSRAASAGVQGEAKLPHAGWWMAHHPGQRFFVTVEALLAEPLFVEVDQRHLAGTPILFPLPELGSVDVVPGPHALEGQRVLLTCSKGEAAGGFSIASTVREGRASFPWVQTGLQVQASVTRGRGNGAPIELAGSGPRTAGEHIELSASDKQARWIIGRALDSAGAPLAATELSAQLCTSLPGAAHATSRAVRTDADGGFVLACDAEWQPGSRRVLALAALCAEGERAEAQVDLSRELAPGENLIGPVRLVDVRH